MNNVIEMNPTNPATHLYGKLRRAGRFASYKALCDCIDAVARDAGWDDQTRDQATREICVGALI